MGHDWLVGTGFPWWYLAPRFWWGAGEHVLNVTKPLMLSIPPSPRSMSGPVLNLLRLILICPHLPTSVCTHVAASVARGKLPSTLIAQVAGNILQKSSTETFCCFLKNLSYPLLQLTNFFQKLWQRKLKSIKLKPAKSCVWSCYLKQTNDLRLDHSKGDA